MTDSLRRSFAVTFTDASDKEVAACLRSLDRVAERLQALSEAGKCEYQDTLSEAPQPVGVVSYLTVLNFFKESGAAGSRSQLTAANMQALFDLRTPTGERVVRFYCEGYNHQPGVCNCLALIRPTTNQPGIIWYRSLHAPPVARLWLMNRDDLLAVTDEQLAALSGHPKTRERVADFINWLRDHPDAP